MAWSPIRPTTAPDRETIRSEALQRIAADLDAELALLDEDEVLELRYRFDRRPATTRASASVTAWRHAVYDRDGHQCRVCGDTSQLHAHHVIGWTEAPHLRLVVENGVTLCVECHALAHPQLAGLIRRAWSHDGSPVEVDG